MIIATGYADMKAIEQVIGDDMVLRKPFQLAELASSVDRALQRMEARAGRSSRVCEPEA
jgi:FixJ family two-component response regulator